MIKEFRYEPPSLPEESKGGTVLITFLAIVAGFCLPTAFALWMGWLDPIFK